MGTVEALFGRDRGDRDQHISAISRERQTDDRRYTCGLDNVDESAKLMQPGGFVVVGAREGQGKTAYIERVIMANAVNHRVLFASLDMRPEVVQDRLLSKSMQVNSERLAALTEQGAPQYENAMQRLGKLDLRIWRPRKGKRSVRDIIAHTEEVDAAILVVDYCRLIDGWDYGKKAADIVDTITDWTQDNGVLTIFLTQLRDEAVNRRPHNGHIQDTTQLAQRADRVQLLYRPYHGRPHKDTIAEVITTKNRWGPPCKNHVGWIGETMDFYPFTGEEEANARCCRANT